MLDEMNKDCGKMIFLMQMQRVQQRKWRIELMGHPMTLMSEFCVGCVELMGPLARGKRKVVDGLRNILDFEEKTHSRSESRL